MTTTRRAGAGTPGWAAALLLLVSGAAADTLWTRVYDAGINCQAAKVRCQGSDVYVVATAYPTSSRTDAKLLKYSGSGVLRWQGTIDRVEIDMAIGVAIGPDNRPVLGSTSGSGTATASIAKFDTGGTRLWLTNRSRSALAGLAAGSDNSVYVVGTRGYPSPWDSLWVARYNASGSAVWHRTFRLARSHTPYGIAVLGEDKVVVAATIVNSTDQTAMLLAFRQNGDTVWTRRYPDTVATSFSGLTVGRAGSILVIAELDDHREVVKFDSLGNRVWRSRISILHAPARDLAVDSLDNVYFAYHDSMNDYKVTKLDPEGRFLDRMFGGTWNSETPTSIAISPADNAPVVTGVMLDGNRPKVLTAKFLPSSVGLTGPATLVRTDFSLRGISGRIPAVGFVAGRTGIYEVLAFRPDGRLAFAGRVRAEAGQRCRLELPLPAAGVFLCRVRGPDEVGACPVFRLR